jgi:hypothetical protein
MITKTVLLKKTPKLIDFEDDTQVIRAFANYEYNCDAREYVYEDIPHIHLKILYADYNQEGYEGDAYVLGYNKSTKQFFEVHGSHCSCYGLEGQWEEEYYADYATFVAAKEKVFAGDRSWSQYAANSDSLKEFLEI